MEIFKHRYSCLSFPKNCVDSDVLEGTHQPLGKKIEEYIHSLQEEKKINVTQLTSCYF